MEKYTLEQAIATMTEIASNPSPLTGSLFTAENVLNILNSIQAPEVKTILQPNWKSDMCEAICDLIEEDISQFVDYDDIELTLNGNEIGVECIGANARAIRRGVEYFIEGINEILIGDADATMEENKITINDEN